MLFRTRIFLIIFLVGMAPTVILLLVSAYLLDSTLDRVGASGMETSVEAAQSLVNDAESELERLMDGLLSDEIPWSETGNFDSWRESNNLDIVFRKSGGYLDVSTSDSVSIDNRFSDIIPDISGLQHLIISGKPVLLTTRADSNYTEGCGILLPEGYAEKGRQLSNAASAAASLSIYKKFSIQLLTGATAISLVIVLLAGIILSRVISGRLVKPLEKLSYGSKRLGGGELDYRIDIPGKDEFAGLAASFNEMASEISENQKKLIRAERLAAWREVARRIAHDIKNPLTPITVELYRLKSRLLKTDDEKSADMAAALDTIDSQIKSLQELASHFSVFAKEPKLQKQKCSIADILNQTIVLYDSLESVAISTSIPDNLPAVNIDPHMMGRVFSNIIKNSIEASPESVEIDINVTISGDALMIIIKDNGPGFPSEKLDNIDTPYITTKKSGTGLGLAIIKKIIDEHGRELKIYNDNGAVVEISLQVE